MARALAGAAPVTLRAGTVDDVAALVAEVGGEVVAMASFGRLSRSHRDFPHVSGDREVMWKLYVHPDRAWPDDVWLRKPLAGGR